MNKTIKALSLVASLVLMGFAPVMADTAPAAPTVTVDGMVDAYYTYNFTDSANKDYATGNIGQYWNTADNSYSLGLAETKITAKQGDASAVVELAYQDDPELALPSGSGLDVWQAYASYTTGAFTLTGGRFATWMGNEVIESTSNMNYSHSLLFWYTIPLWHQGISVSLAVDPTLSITGYATNGWNNNLNTAAFTAETFGLNATWTPNSTWKFVLNGIDGPGNNSIYGSANTGQDKWVGEFIASYAPTSDLTFGLDAEYGAQDLGYTRTWFFTPTATSTNINSLDFWGAALYAKYAIASDWSASLRLEEFKDLSGTLGLYNHPSPYTNFAATGYTNEAREATLTVVHNLAPAFTVSAEGRYDYVPTEDGVTPTNGSSLFSGGSTDQLTATLSTAFVF